MEQTKNVIVTKRDAKKISELSRLLSLLGISVEDLQAITLLKSELEKQKVELKDFIKKSVEEMRNNVSKSLANSENHIENQMKTYLFRGAKINEQV